MKTVGITMEVDEATLAENGAPAVGQVMCTVRKTDEEPGRCYRIVAAREVRRRTPGPAKFALRCEPVPVPAWYAQIKWAFTWDARRRKAPP